MEPTIRALPDDLPITRPGQGRDRARQTVTANRRFVTVCHGDECSLRLEDGATCRPCFRLAGCGAGRRPGGADTAAGVFRIQSRNVPCECPSGFAR